MTVASAAIAVCGCGGIVVVQRMVTVMKWRCKPETPSRTGASVTLRCVVACAWSALWRCVCDVMLMDVVITVALVTVTGVTTQVWVSVGVELVLRVR